MKIKTRQRRPPRVEILPLIDVVFLLLIFFIYAMLSMAVHRGLNLDLPESSSAEISKDELLSISVKKHGGEHSGLLVQVDDERVQLTMLGEHLKRLASEKKNVKVKVFAEESISYQELFTVLDQIKSGGISGISLQANQAQE